HAGAGELCQVSRLPNDLYAVEYNIDGCTWLYEAQFNSLGHKLTLEKVICGQSELAGGVVGSWHYDGTSDRYSISFSTATTPTQIYTIEGTDRSAVVCHTRERVLGIAPELLSSGEDCSFISFDGTRISARLYLPADSLGIETAHPVIYYIHGGPQSQERPDFAWFSMPLIQYLTLNGFAVFVPNVRGSSGYGLRYTKQVDQDWGGMDRLDHVHAMQQLAQDPRLDTSRTGVVGRSYGGYMTLTLAGRHPGLWKAAVDMFGPYDLITFSERIPETWKPYFKVALGDVESDREFLVERSPRTHIDGLTCPLLVIQGKNDPRVVEAESRDLVEYLRHKGKQVEYLMFENEGHDILKYENRVRCYSAITEFFKKHLLA
ncbi:MAG: alpha/beta fold hydrolase, partial [Anaerolineaceae bacterium]|nr:alpha/beta fold hydrolase [Anaerolineaceae bacterium]